MPNSIRVSRSGSVPPRGAAARRPGVVSLTSALEIELDALNHADQVALVPGIKRSGRTVSYTSTDPLTIYKIARVIMALSRD